MSFTKIHLFIISLISFVLICFAEEEALLEKLCHPTELRSRKTCECTNDNESPWGLPGVKIDCSFKNLKSFDFPGEVLPLYSDTFDISWNKLEYVPSFESESLKILNVMHNNISELVEKNFQHLTMLRELYVSWNAIQTISSNAFENLKYLQVLDMSHNNIKQIGFNVFSYLVSLNKLDISWNRQLNHSDGLHDFYAELGVPLKLEVLKLEQCGLKNIILPEHALLSSLSLRDNNFENIPNQLPLSLKEFDFSGNPLPNLSDTHTSKLMGLEIFFLEDMPSLTTVEINSLANLTKLKALSFQNCRHLSYFHEYAFGENTKVDKRNLEVLTFRGSAISTFNETLLPVFKQLKQIDFNGMPLRCDCEMVWIKNLEIETNGRCITPSRLRGVKLNQVQKKDFSCDYWPKWVYGCLILLTLILCAAGISLVVIGLRPKSNRVSMRRKVGSNSPYARVTIEPNRQDNSYY